MMGMATAVTYEESKEAFNLALFAESHEGVEAFEKYWQRLQQRSVETPLLDPVPLDKGANNQIGAVLNADKPENARWPDPLAALKMPVLVANGNNDLTLGLVRTLDLHARLTNSQLVLYPNSGHGFLWQYSALFAKQINLFLDSDAFDIA
jgi:pimeloyl-ACP methyl ester carboxylesterase